MPSFGTVTERAFGFFSRIRGLRKCVHREKLSCQFSEYVGDYGWTNNTIVVQFVNLFGFYWAINFVTAFGQFTLAGAFASWYFAFKKPEDVPTLPLFSAFLRTFWHVGTLAFGSLIIALVQILRNAFIFNLYFDW